MEYKNIKKYLFRSKLRTLLLLNFLISPKEEFYMRDLARRFSTSAGNVRRELIKLAEFDIIGSRKLGNLVLFKLTNNDQADKWARLAFEKFAEVFLQKPFFELDFVETVFIYGSYARGTFSKDSDIDLFVITKDELSDRQYSQIHSAIGRLEKLSGLEINPEIMTGKEFGRRIKEDDPYVLDVSKNQKIFIKGGEDDIQF